MLMKHILLNVLISPQFYKVHTIDRKTKTQRKPRKMAKRTEGKGK